MKRILFELSTAAGIDERGQASERTDGQEERSGFSVLSDGRFRKELIREGTWVHPTRNFRLSVTRDRMRRWVEKFRLMRERGIRVPVPFGHSYDPKENAGFVEELVLDGNVLFAVLNIPRPEDAQKLGQTVKDVSLSINPDFRDGQGRRYGEVIEHVALTTRPVVSGQGDFVPLSLPDGSQAELWRFEVESLRPRRLAGEPDRRATDSADTAAEEQPASEEREEPAAEPRRLEVDPEEFRRLFGVPEGTEPEKLLAAAAVRYQALEAQVQAGAESAGEAESDDEDESGQALPLEAQRELAELRQQHLEGEVEALVRAGRLTPAMREPARRLLALAEPVSAQLAAGSAQVDVARELRALLEAVPAHALIDLRERTLFEASRPVGEMTDERAAKLAEENRRLAKLEA